VSLRRASTPSPDKGAPNQSRPSTAPASSATQTYAAPAPREPTLLERRIAAANAGSFDAGDTSPAPSPSDMPLMPMMPGMGGMPGAASTSAAAPRMSANDNLAYSAKALSDVSSATPLQHPDTLMLRGTLIRCVLETRIVTDNPGFTSCTVTEPVYSFTGKRLLLPKGSKVMGKYEMEPSGPRLAVIWDRVVTPTGIDVSMESPGVDTLGGSGHPGHHNAHWGSRITAALFISLLSDAFKYAGAEYGPTTTSITNGVVTQSPFESNTAETVQQLAGQAVRRQANRPATVTINQGTVLAIHVAKDVDFASVLARN
jgi:type IV secretion system protein VirB10